MIYKIKIKPMIFEVKETLSGPYFYYINQIRIEDSATFYALWQCYSNKKTMKRFYNDKSYSEETKHGIIK